MVANYILPRQYAQLHDVIMALKLYYLDFLQVSIINIHCCGLSVFSEVWSPQL